MPESNSSLRDASFKRNDIENDISASIQLIKLTVESVRLQLIIQLMGQSKLKLLKFMF